MNRTKWAVAGVGVVTAGLLAVVGVTVHQSSGPAGQSTQKVSERQVTAAADETAADKTAADKAAADKAAADEAAAGRALAAQKVGETTVTTAKKAAAAEVVADKAEAVRTQNRTELQAEATVNAYFSAINAGNFRTAYDRGGKNFNSSYQSFVAGFDNTGYDAWDVTGVDGNRVYVTLTAYNKDCTTQVWTGYYVVNGTTLSSAHLRGGKFQLGECAD